MATQRSRALFALACLAIATSLMSPATAAKTQATYGLSPTLKLKTIRLDTGPQEIRILKLAAGAIPDIQPAGPAVPTSGEGEQHDRGRRGARRRERRLRHGPGPAGPYADDRRRALDVGSAARQRGRLVERWLPGLPREARSPNELRVESQAVSCRIVERTAGPDGRVRLHRAGRHAGATARHKHPDRQRSRLVRRATGTRVRAGVERPRTRGDREQVRRGGTTRAVPADTARDRDDAGRDRACRRSHRRVSEPRHGALRRRPGSDLAEVGRLAKHGRRDRWRADPRPGRRERGPRVPQRRRPHTQLPATHRGGHHRRLFGLRSPDRVRHEPDHGRWPPNLDELVEGRAASDPGQHVDQRGIMGRAQPRRWRIDHDVGEAAEPRLLSALPRRGWLSGEPTHDELKRGERSTRMALVVLPGADAGTPPGLR